MFSLKRNRAVCVVIFHRFSCYDKLAAEYNIGYNSNCILISLFFFATFSVETDSVWDITNIPDIRNLTDGLQ